MTEFNGSVNSFLSMGGSDGPGVRSVVFMQGCPLRCIYCHNPETWEFEDNNTNSDDLIKKIIRFKPYYKQNGGVTISGGEPLCQQNFVLNLLKKLKEQGINTCIDTSAQADLSNISELLNFVDLVLLDIKFLSQEEYKKYTNGDFNKVLQFLEIAETLDIPLWIRHVLVPDITDNEQYVLRLKEFCSKFPNIQKIELLPFKNICKSKYDDLGIKFKMENVLPVSSELHKKLQDLM